MALPTGRPAPWAAAGLRRCMLTPTCWAWPRDGRSGGVSMARGLARSVGTVKAPLGPSAHC
eukprot:16438341-Heterocapsa_arctica.AAC.1